MTYAGLAAAYLLAPIVVISIIFFARKGWMQFDEPDAITVADSSCDTSCGGIFALLKKERHYEEQLAEVRDELERLKAQPEPSLSRSGRMRLEWEWWQPRLLKVVPWCIGLVIASWTLVSLASAWILGNRVLRNPGLAITEVSSYLVADVPDVFWTGAVILTSAVVIFLLNFALASLVAALLKGRVDSYRNWQEASQVRVPYLESQDEWLSGQLEQTRADLDWLQTALRKRFSEAGLIAHD